MFLRVRVQTWACLGWVGKKGMLELGNMPDKVHMDTGKAASKTNGGGLILLWETGF